MLTSRQPSCVWLGEGDASSAMAFRFIQKEVLQLQNFDELCDSKEASKKWGALLDLMQRQWFSRRWVVQEISLARDAIIYCGSDMMPVRCSYLDPCWLLTTVSGKISLLRSSSLSRLRLQLIGCPKS